MSTETEVADNVKIVEWSITDPIKVQLAEAVLGGLTTDEETGALVTIESVHHEVHEGRYFTSTYVNTSIGNNGTVDIRIVVKTSELHYVAEVKAGGLCTIDFYEGSNLSGGTALATINHYRGRGDANADYTVFHTPVVTAVGTKILQKIIASGSSPQTRIGGELRQTDEFILSPNTTYLLRVTNLSGASTPVGIVISGYTR